jgi:hypothetical protein
MKTIRIGTKGSLMVSPVGVKGWIRRKPMKVVLAVMQIFPMNMKMEAMPSTIPNLTEFLRVSRKALMAELQKDSFERAM